MPTLNIIEEPLFLTGPDHKSHRAVVNHYEVWKAVKHESCHTLLIKRNPKVHAHPYVVCTWRHTDPNAWTGGNYILNESDAIDAFLEVATRRQQQGV